MSELGPIPPLPGCFLPGIIAPGAELPERLTLRDLRASAQVWIRAAGIPYEGGILLAPLGDGRVARWDPRRPDLFPSLDGTADLVFAAICQWIEEPAEAEDKLGQVLAANPRWQAFLHRLQQGGNLRHGRIARALVAWGFPSTPGAVLHTLSKLSTAEPRRRIEDDPDRPGHFRVVPFQHPPHPATRGTLLSSLALLLVWQEPHTGAWRHQVEVVHLAAVARNWATRETWRALEALSRRHADWLQKRVFPKQRLREGYLRALNGRVQDALAADIAEHLAGAIDEATVFERERERFTSRYAKLHGRPPSPDHWTPERDRVRKRLQSARKRWAPYREKPPRK